MPLRTEPRSARQDLALFDGQVRTKIEWNPARKDNHLWSEGDTCPVYFHARGNSRRGPTLKIPLTTLDRLNSTYLKDRCLYRQEPVHAPSSPTTSEDDSSDSGYGASICSEGTANATCQLFVPAAAGGSRDESLKYHLTTRNYFAFLHGKPLIGWKLTTSLLDLWARIRTWSTSIGVDDFLKYCRQQDYLTFAGNPDRAVAILVWAETARCRDAWIDAFAHCVGMHEHLDDSDEADSISFSTRALLARASADMRHHVQRAVTSMGTFLEQEFSAENLGLSKHARDHLDLFRSFLQSFYVAEIGYYPPASARAWHKGLSHRMQADFQSVYEYLADKGSSSDATSVRVLNGGICIEQNVQVFDERNGFMPLEFALPLLPDQLSVRRQSESSKTLRNLRRLSRGGHSAEHKTLMRLALAQAANPTPEVVTNSLVQEYMKFERLQLPEKISAAEARKVRWLLVYGALQMLNSINRAPKEVQDTTTPSYPLCVSPIGWPQWVMYDDAMSHASENASSPSEQREDPIGADDNLNDDADHISIHPDCEADNAEDFFAAKTQLSRSMSDLESIMMSPVKVSAMPLSRTASLRSSVTSLHRSMVGSLSRRGSISRRNTLMPGALAPRRVSSFINEPVAEHEVSDPEDAIYMRTSLQMTPHQDAAEIFRADGHLHEPMPALTTPHNVHTNDTTDDNRDDQVLEPTLERHQLLSSDWRHSVPSIPSSVSMRDLDGSDFLSRLSTVRHGSHPIPSLADYDTPSEYDSPPETEPIQPGTVREYQRRKENHRRLSALNFGFLGLRSSEQEDAGIDEEDSFAVHNTATAANSDCHEETLRMLNGTNSPHIIKTTTTSVVSLNAGTYVPTGLTTITSTASRNARRTSVVEMIMPGFSPSLPTRSTPQRSRHSHLRDISDQSSFSHSTTVSSSPSSVYPEVSQQAAEIAEEDVRGRRRSRALDRLPNFGRMRLANTRSRFRLRQD